MRRETLAIVGEKNPASWVVRDSSVEERSQGESSVEERRSQGESSVEEERSQGLTWGSRVKGSTSKEKEVRR